jgi:purine-binding chemotaxis protein CheW
MPTRALKAAKNADNGSKSDANSTPFVVASLDGLRCGLPAAAVVEITRAVAITRLPSAPRGVEGVVDYHGVVIPVIDLRDRLGMTPRTVRASDHFVIANADGRVVGFRVDSATALAEVSPADVTAAERVVAGTRPVAGVARTSEGLMLLQDLGALLSQAEEERLRAAMAHANGPGRDA